MNTDEIEKYTELENQANQLIETVATENNCDPQRQSENGGIYQTI